MPFAAVHRSRLAHSDHSRHCSKLVASLIGRFESSAFKPSTTTFQTIHHCSVDIARGLVLLFGIGARALPLWDSRTRRNNLLGGLTVRLTAGPSDQTNSPHPSSREGHLSTAWWNSSVLPIACDLERFSCSYRGLFPGPAELGAINPYAVHDDGQSACQGHDCLLLPTTPGDLHRPGF